MKPPPVGRLPLRGRWLGAAETDEGKPSPPKEPGHNGWGTFGRSLSQPAADSSLYAREPLYRPTLVPGFARSTLS